MGSRNFTIGNVRLVTTDKVVDAAWVSVVDGKVQQIGLGQVPQGMNQNQATGSYIDGLGQWLMPGFIDMHVHGGDGGDVMDGKVSSLERIAGFHSAHGTTAWLPTTLTASIPALQQAIRAVDEARQKGTLDASILGVHLEGPFIEPSKAGAQNPQYIIPPDVSSCDQLLNTVPGIVRKMTIAPERDGAEAVIKRLREQGVIPSIGHTNTTMERALQVIATGPCHATHLFNGMRALHHREGGPVAALLLDDRAMCELIADGVHVDAGVMKLIVRLKGADKIALITDAMAAAGRPDGTYELGGLAVTVEDGIAYLTEGHNLAGSTLTMDKAVRNMVNRVGVSLPEAAQMASGTPARELGVQDSKGNLAVGMDADMVLLDESFSVVRTWVEGREVYKR